jgi:regulator of replication initiation timing
MTKQEVVDKINDLSNQLDEIESDVDNLVSNLKRAKRLIEDLPSEVDEFDEDEEKEKE